MTENGKRTGLGVVTASAFVIANMIGTGAFTSLGFQLMTTPNPVAIGIIWLAGGLVALCGALVYSELGAMLPRSGGEYNYLSEIYHPFVGFLAGWVSIIVGFAAPVALACMALSSYICNIWPGIHPELLAVAVLTATTLWHSFDIKVGTGIQRWITLLKVLIIIVFITAGFLVVPGGKENFSAVKDFNPSELMSTGFAVSLIWVYYAYSGWNASAYISNDIRNPQKNIPLSLILSTIFVTLLYLCLNFIFLRTTPVADLTGQIEIGLISAKNIFGNIGGTMMGVLIAFMLVSSISSMVFVGPRVGMTMGEDHRIFHFLTRKNKRGCPTVAVWFQWAISMIMILTGSFRVISQYTGVILSLCALMTVAGVYVMRIRRKDLPRPFKTPGYPVTPLLFIVLISWSIIYLVRHDYTMTFVTHEQSAMWTTILSLATILTGVIVWYINKLISSKK